MKNCPECRPHLFLPYADQFVQKRKANASSHLAFRLFVIVVSCFLLFNVVIGISVNNIGALSVMSSGVHT
jgi:hypothetical protein